MDLKLRAPVIGEDSAADGAVLLLHVRMVCLRLEEDLRKDEYLIGLPADKQAEITLGALKG